MSEISPHIYCISFSITFIVIVSCLVSYLNQSYEHFLEFKQSSLLNREIGIQEKMPKSDEAFKILETNFTKVYEFINKLEKKHPNHEDVKRFVRRMDNVKIEESKNEEGTSSYTVNKGELMSICVRFKPDNSKFHSDNTMWFVIIHELAHVMSVNEGHGSEFIKNFKFLLKESESLGMYEPVDYSNNNIVYCGVKVTNNPFF